MNQPGRSVTADPSAATARRFIQLRPLVAMLAAAGALCAVPAHAFEIQTDNPDVKMRWDNTFKYSTAYRLKSPSAALLPSASNPFSPNFDDGNQNFGKGIVSSRVDVLSEFDIAYQNFGARVSAAAWYDQMYNRRNDNNSPGTNNSTSVPYNEFNKVTRDLHGRDAEILDAFVYGQFDLDGKQATVRVGKHTLLYGESLFFGGNGIAGAQAPVDVIKALSVPGSQTKEILMPVNQISAQIQLNSEFSLGGYYQFEWEKLRLPGVGSFVSGVDIGGSGVENLWLPVAPNVWVPIPHGADAPAKDSGQGGLQVRYRPNGGDTVFGFYALNFHSKVPRPGFNSDGTFGFTYTEDTKLYGVSFANVLGDASVAGELSVRRNTSFANAPGPQGVIPMGNSAHAQVSAIYALPPSGIWDNASIVSEVAWNRVTNITKNAAFIDPNTDRDAWGFRVLFEPTWYQVMPLLDISTPINLGYSPKGRSAVAPVGTHQGGDLTLGVNGEYAKLWKFGVSYTHYFGKEDFINTYKQHMKDRDFISFNVQRTF